jgi:hypothetical protein
MAGGAVGRSRTTQIDLKGSRAAREPPVDPPKALPRGYMASDGSCEPIQASAIITRFTSGYPNLWVPAGGVTRTRLGSLPGTTGPPAE